MSDSNIESKDLTGSIDNAGYNSDSNLDESQELLPPSTKRSDNAFEGHLLG